MHHTYSISFKFFSLWKKKLYRVKSVFETDCGKECSYHRDITQVSAGTNCLTNSTFWS